MGLEITGKLFKVQPEVTGEGKNGTWRKQEFVIETIDDKYPKKICFEIWGDKIGSLSSYSEGDSLKVYFELESRPYQDRWFTGAKAWRIERDGEGGGGGGSYNNSSSNTNSNSSNRVNAPIAQDPFPDELSGGGGAEDLPF